MIPLKDYYSPVFYQRLTDNLSKVIDIVDQSEFLERIYVPHFQQMELKQRMRHTTEVVHGYLPSAYPAAVEVLYELIGQLRKDHYGEDTLPMMFLPDYIERYGQDNYATSVKAIEFITQFITCEFAVRPFLQKYFDPMMEQMKAWSLHKNEKVRRLASEGSRPALPWGIAVPRLKKDPSPILPILENLKNDPSESVRRSVANSLNDISKKQPEIVLNIAARWSGTSRETDAIIKHACRSLLKSGHTGILAHYNLTSDHIDLTNFEIETPEVKIGDLLAFNFTVKNMSPEKQRIRLEYALYYKRLNGTLSKKVFKISEVEYAPGQIVAIRRRQSFRIITTRKFYAGQHFLSVILNGKESELKSFELVD